MTQYINNPVTGNQIPVVKRTYKFRPPRYILVVDKRKCPYRKDEVSRYVCRHDDNWGGSCDECPLPVMEANRT